jgi:hypothetical protein
MNIHAEKEGGSCPEVAFKHTFLLTQRIDARTLPLYNEELSVGAFPK